MPYAKTSQRAEQRALREEMRALGMSRQQVAAEFSRRYRLRPRAAWRHAHGWSLTEAAEQINSYAAQIGLDGDGTTVTMTAAHLCEHENWPGEGPRDGEHKPTGRKPTPYLLSLLAAVYGCAIHDLLDLDDHRCLPPADRLTLDKTTPTHQHEEQDIPPSDPIRQPRRAWHAPPLPTMASRSMSRRRRSWAMRAGRPRRPPCSPTGSGPFFSSVCKARGPASRPP